MTQVPTFNRSLLHPRYWLTWVGIGLLYLLVLLPYPVIYWLGTSIGRFAMRFLKRRVAIAQRNLELCFSRHAAGRTRCTGGKEFRIGRHGAV